LLVGRGEECDIALNDTSVSRVHADIEPDESGRYRINDQQSSNGVRVNGVDVQSTTLYSGDIIELGDVQLQFVPKGQSFTRSDHPQAVLAAVRTGPLGNMTRAQRWAALAVGTALIATVFAWALSADPPQAARPLQTSPASEAFEQARMEFQRGNIDAAHRALLTIRNDSNLRSAKVFRQIEAAWADEQLRLAETTRDVDSRRRILGAVARAETVESTRRQDALDRLASLGAQAPEDLPLQGATKAQHDAGARRERGKPKRGGKSTPRRSPAPKSPPNTAARKAPVVETSPEEPVEMPVSDPPPAAEDPELPRKPGPSVTTSVP
jgi:hypothetical protein